MVTSIRAPFARLPLHRCFVFIKDIGTADPPEFELPLVHWDRGT